MSEMVKLFFMVGESTMASPWTCVNVPPASAGKIRLRCLFQKIKQSFFSLDIPRGRQGLGIRLWWLFVRSDAASEPATASRFCWPPWSPFPGSIRRYARPQSHRAVGEKRSVRLVFALLRPHCCALRLHTRRSTQGADADWRAGAPFGDRSLAPPSNQHRSMSDGGGTAAGHRRQQVEVWR